MSERTEAYHQYVKLFTEQHIPLVQKHNAAVANGVVQSDEEQRALDSILEQLDVLFRQMSEEERKLTRWWGVRANANDYVNLYNFSVDSLMSSEYTAEALKDMYQRFLEQTGWLISVISNDYLNKTAPPEGWEFKTEPCDCKDSETTSG